MNYDPDTLALALLDLAGQMHDGAITSDEYAAAATRLDSSDDSAVESDEASETPWAFADDTPDASAEGEMQG